MQGCNPRVDDRITLTSITVKSEISSESGLSVDYTVVSEHVSESTPKVLPRYR